MLLIETELHWWDRNTPEDKKHLENWYKRVINKYTPSGLEFKDRVDVNPRDSQFFFRNGVPINNHADLLFIDGEFYHCLFKDYNSLMKKIDRCQSKLNELLLGFDKVPSGYDLDIILKNFPRLRGKTLIDGFVDPQHKTLGFGVPCLTTHHPQYGRCFADTIHSPIIAEKPYPIKAFKNIPAICKEISRLDSLETKIHTFHKNLSGGVVTLDTNTKYGRYTDPQYQIQNGQLFVLLESMVNDLRFAFMRFIKQGVNKKIKVFNPKEKE